MTRPPQSIESLQRLLTKVDGQAFRNYRLLAGKWYAQKDHLFHFVHIQGSPGAYPASVCHLVIKNADLGLPDSCLANTSRRLATADYLLRAFNAGVNAHALQNRGARGSGSFQPIALPPQILERNIVKPGLQKTRIRFRISLPGSTANRILGKQAICMLTQELPGIVRTLKETVANTDQLMKHCDTVEDMIWLQSRLSSYGLVAFIGDGAILPRCSGDSQEPLLEGAVGIKAPDELAVEVRFPNCGRKRGLGIKPGVNVLIGGGFHGKSTLLKALAKGIYPHLPGDGREQVVTRRDAVFISSEEGRVINGLDLSPFIGNLPGRSDSETFRTENASGSTSQAAAIIETVLSGAKLLLIDEDSSATNFLIKDRHLRRLMPEDPITPLFDRVRELYSRYQVSTLIVVGGSSEYLGVAENVIAMRNYMPVSMTKYVRDLSLPAPFESVPPLVICDKRRVLHDNFDPSFKAIRIGKTIAVRIKPLRLQERILEYGDVHLNLTHLTALVDPDQVLAIGYAILLIRNRFKELRMSPSDLALTVCGLIETESLDTLCQEENRPLFLAAFRSIELAGAINRFKDLKIFINGQQR
jgi:predicted ABC-class ATPase